MYISSCHFIPIRIDLHQLHTSSCIYMYHLFVNLHPFASTGTWQLLTWPFWDGAKGSVTAPPTIGDQKLQLNHWEFTWISRSIYLMGYMPRFTSAHIYLHLFRFISSTFKFRDLKHPKTYNPHCGSGRCTPSRWGSWLHLWLCQGPVGHALAAKSQTYNKKTRTIYFVDCQLELISYNCLRSIE